MAGRFLYVTILSILIPTFATSFHHKHNIKSMHFTLYQHDIVNKTDYLIVPSPLGSNATDFTTPFGTIGVISDKLTKLPNPSSKVIGNVESVAITSSFDGLDSLSIGRVRLELENGVTGSISLLGVINAIKSSDNSIVGGTGDFLFVQGYVTATFVSLERSNSSYVYKQDFHLFWPSYFRNH